VLLEALRHCMSGGGAPLDVPGGAPGAAETLLDEERVASAMPEAGGTPGAATGKTSNVADAGGDAEWSSEAALPALGELATCSAGGVDTGSGAVHAT